MEAITRRVESALFSARAALDCLTHLFRTYALATRTEPVAGSRTENASSGSSSSAVCLQRAAVRTAAAAVEVLLALAGAELTSTDASKCLAAVCGAVDADLRHCCR